MKKNLLAVLLPVVAGVALSGTGFGLWVFNETVSDKLVGASMQVEPAINFKSDALSIESLTVTNVNTKAADDGKAIVFDQSDALAASGDRWTVNIEVGVTYEALLGALRAEANVTNGLGDYSEATNVANYKASELQDALKLYKVTVYSPLSSADGKKDTDCKISGYLTSSADVSVNLKDFVGVPATDGSFGSEGALTKITKTFTFTFAPSQNYKDIDTAGEYKTFRDKVKESTFNFTAAFENA